MAEQKKGKNRKQLRPDTLVEQLVPDPAQPPQEVRTLVGFLGKSAQAGFWRLYLTSQLNEYVEFREEDVVHSQSLTTEQSPLGGTMVWIKQDVKLQHTRTVSARRVQAEFLQGSIMAQFLRTPYLARQQRARREGGAYMPGTDICPPDSVICPSFAICVSRDICPPPIPRTDLCGTANFACPSDLCESKIICRSDGCPPD